MDEVPARYSRRFKPSKQTLGVVDRWPPNDSVTCVYFLRLKIIKHIMYIYIYLYTNACLIRQFDGYKHIMHYIKISTYIKPNFITCFSREVTYVGLHSKP